MSDPKEHIVINKTGGRKGAKLARFDLIPCKPLWELAEHYGKVLQKYPARNWEKGFDWSLSYAAAQRHLNEFWNGNDNDTQDHRSKHVIAAAWHCFALSEWMETHPELDDRPKKRRRINHGLCKDNL